MYLVNSDDGAARERLLRLKNRRRKPIIARKRTPPTTPPAIAPAFTFLEESEESAMLLEDATDVGDDDHVATGVAVLDSGGGFDSVGEVEFPSAHSTSNVVFVKSTFDTQVGSIPSVEKFFASVG